MPDRTLEQIAKETCKLDGCLNLLQMRGMCDKHRKMYPTRRVCLSDADRKKPRPAIIKGDIALVPLGVNAKDGYAIIDSDRADEVDESKWYLSSHGYARTGSHMPTSLHTLIKGSPPNGLVIDHINRNKLDNRRSNLRFVTQSDNHKNKGIRSDNTTGFKGVINNRGKYRIALQIGKEVFTGGRLYATAEEAFLEYKRLSIKHQGEYSPYFKEWEQTCQID